MTENGNHPGVKAAEARRRVPGSGPILLLAVLFVAAASLAWYFSWFGRELSDADISKYLAEENKPRHVQHALLKVQERIERGDALAKNWYPQIIALSNHQETEFRLTVAWLMGFDNQSEEFHSALLRLVQDEEPIVRRNAALALVRFRDHSGREEIVSILKPYPVKAPVDGVIASSLEEGSLTGRRALLARLRQADGKVVEIRSPLPGRISKILKPNGSEVKQADEVLNLNSDEDSIWEALRALSLVGTAEDLTLIESYANSSEVAGRIREQAALTMQAIHRLHK